MHAQHALEPECWVVLFFGLTRKLLLTFDRYLLYRFFILVNPSLVALNGMTHQHCNGYALSAQIQWSEGLFVWDSFPSVCPGMRRHRGHSLDGTIHSQQSGDCEAWWPTEVELESLAWCGTSTHLAIKWVPGLSVIKCLSINPRLLKQIYCWPICCKDTIPPARATAFLHPISCDFCILRVLSRNSQKAVMLLQQCNHHSVWTIPHWTNTDPSPLGDLFKGYWYCIAIVAGMV